MAADKQALCSKYVVWGMCKHGKPVSQGSHAVANMVRNVPPTCKQRHCSSHVTYRRAPSPFKAEPTRPSQVHYGGEASLGNLTKGINTCCRRQRSTMERVQYIVVQVQYRVCKP
jgi:hypothetical protein